MTVKQALLLLWACATCALALQPVALAGQRHRTHRHHRIHRKAAHAGRPCRRAHPHKRCPHRLRSARKHLGARGVTRSSPPPSSVPGAGPSLSSPSLPSAELSAPGGVEEAASAPEAGGVPAPARVQVLAREYSFTLSRSEVPAGKVIVEFVNGGEDPHNLHLQPGEEEPEVGSFPTSKPGAHEDQAFNMPAGSYTLFCSLPGQEAKGMKATLTVR
jgi:plastocyanin